MLARLGPPLKNLISQAIVDRIKKAHESKEMFKAFIVLPLLPAFPGDITTSGANVMKIQMYW